MFSFLAIPARSPALGPLPALFVDVAMNLYLVHAHLLFVAPSTAFKLGRIAGVYTRVYSAYQLFIGMRGICSATVALALGILDIATAQVVTITEYASACSAVYTTSSRTVTVVQSTVTVQPAPWNDTAANNGTPFVLELSPALGSTRRRQSSQATYLLANGNTTANASMAAQYKIIDGQLLGANGGFVTTNPGIAHEPFAIASTAGSISTNFFVNDGILSWDNSAFDNGTAMLFKTPATLAVNAEIIIRFSGEIDPSWAAVSLAAKPGMYNTTTRGCRRRLTSAQLLPQCSQNPRNRYLFRLISSSDRPLQHPPHLPVCPRGPPLRSLLLAPPHPLRRRMAFAVQVTTA